MSSFRGFVIKELRQIARDRGTLGILLGMPVIMMILFGFAIRSELNRVPISILDHSNDPVTRSLIGQLEANPSFRIVAFLDGIHQVEPLFRRGEVRQVVIFEADFSERLLREGVAEIQLISDATDPNMATLLHSYTLGTLQVQAVREHPEGDEATHLTGAVPGAVQPLVRMMYNPELRSARFFVPGLVAVILMLISTLMTSISITREKEMGNLEVVLVSPIRPWQMILGKVLPYLLLSFINVAVILILSRFLFDVPFRGSLLLFLAESGLFIVTALALGVFISTVSNHQQTAMMISLAGLLMPTVLLSGFIFPLSSMPAPLQWLSHIIPARWFLSITRGIMLKGTGLQTLWKETLFLLLFAATFIGLSLKKFNERLQ